MGITTEAAAAASSTRTRRRGRERAEYRVAGAAMREARARFSQARAEGRIKCKASAEVLMTLLAEIGGYSRINDSMSVRQIEELTGIARSTVARSLAELEEAGCISRVQVEHGRRGLIALPVVEPPEEEIREFREPVEEPVPPGIGVPREPGRCPTHGMGHTEKKASEKKEKLCEEVNVRSRAREAGRSEGPPSRSPVPVEITQLAQAVRPRSIRQVIAEPRIRALTAEEDRKNRELLAEIERRKVHREAVA